MSEGRRGPKRRKMVTYNIYQSGMPRSTPHEARDDRHLDTPRLFPRAPDVM